MYVAEIVIEDQPELAEYVRPDELQLAFNFLFLHERWDAAALRRTIDRTWTAFDAVGAPPSWVLENHDVTRVPTRYGGGEEGRRRARAATLLLLGLPGAVFVYQGQELGLAEVEIPDELRQDPIFFRTNGARAGRDGCRVPIPWSGGPPGFGFTAGAPWLPMPDAWRDETVEAQRGDAGLEPRALPPRAGAATRLRGAAQGLLRVAREPGRDARVRAHGRRRDDRVRGQRRRRASAAAGGRARARERAAERRGVAARRRRLAAHVRSSAARGRRP